MTEPASTADGILDLQRQAGNAAVARLLQSGIDGAGATVAVQRTPPDAAGASSSTSGSSDQGGARSTSGGGGADTSPDFQRLRRYLGDLERIRQTGGRLVGLDGREVNLTPYQAQDTFDRARQMIRDMATHIADRIDAYGEGRQGASYARFLPGAERFMPSDASDDLNAMYLRSGQALAEGHLVRGLDDYLAVDHAVHAADQSLLDSGVDPGEGEAWRAVFNGIMEAGIVVASGGLAAAVVPEGALSTTALTLAARGAIGGAIQSGMTTLNDAAQQPVRVASSVDPGRQNLVQEGWVTQQVVNLGVNVVTGALGGPLADEIGTETLRQRLVNATASMELNRLGSAAGTAVSDGINGVRGEQLRNDILDQFCVPMVVGDLIGGLAGVSDDHASNVEPRERYWAGRQERRQGYAQINQLRRRQQEAQRRTDNTTVAESMRQAYGEGATSPTFPVRNDPNLTPGRARMLARTLRNMAGDIDRGLANPGLQPRVASATNSAPQTARRGADRPRPPAEFVNGAATPTLADSSDLQLRQQALVELRLAAQQRAEQYRLWAATLEGRFPETSPSRPQIGGSVSSAAGPRQP